MCPSVNLCGFNINLMALSFIKKIPWLAKLYIPTIEPRAQVKIERTEKHLQPNSKILDIGSGIGGLAYAFQKRGHNMTCLDVVDHSFFPEIQPVIYDGKSFPFEKKSFDTAMIITVLHHTTTQREIISEAKRVANQVIIMEDVYTNSFQKYLTYFMDSLVNLEFKGHPHSNRNEQEWEQLFTELNLEIVDKEVHRFLLFFRQVTYLLK